MEIKRNMNTIILYSKHLRNVSGVQTFELAFLQSFHKKYRITVIYELGDREIIEQFKKYADVIRNDGKSYMADTCIYSSVYKDNANIHANKYIQVVHTDYNHWGVKHNPNGIDEHVAVSKPVHDSLFDNSGITSTVIPNLLLDVELDEVMRFVSATRVAKGKGIERIKDFVEWMTKNGQLFTFEIFGEGSRMDMDKYTRMFEPYPTVNFMGVSRRVQSFMNKADYVVQFSENEGFCYSIYEAMAIGIPVIVSPWEGVQNIVTNGKNGYIIDMQKEVSFQGLMNIFYEKPSRKKVIEHFNEKITSHSELMEKWERILFIN